MYTSRLPISTSVRRPNSHAEGSTSFVGLNRPSSHIPVTVRKANLFTPQTQRRPFSSGASTAGKSAYMSSMTTDKKYQRPLKPVPDRELQIKMFDTLVDYLRTYAPNLPPPEAKKFFSSVSTTESSRIFEVLIGRLVPDFKINRLETDVPEALSTLDYPYIRSVTKSALVSVTTRQASVGLLVIFYWLIGSILDTETQDVVDNVDLVGEDGEIQRNVILKPETVSEANLELFERLYATENYEFFQKELQATNAEIDDLNQYLGELEDLIQESQTLDDDMEKFKEYQDQMVKYLNTKRAEENEVKQLCSQLEFQDEHPTRREEEIRLQIKNHELEAEDVRKNKARVVEMESRLSVLQQQLDELIAEEQEVEATIESNLAKFRMATQQGLFDMKELFNVYDSQHIVDSQHCAERRLGTKDWATRLEELPQNDLAQNSRAHHEQQLFVQGLEGTRSSFESEIRENMIKSQKQLEGIKTSKENTSKEILRLKAALIRVEREAETEKCQLMDAHSRICAKSELEEHLAIQSQEEYEKKEADQLKFRELQLQGLKSDKAESAEVIELRMTHLKTLLEGNLQKATNMVKDVKQETERWQEEAIIAEENNKVAKKALKSLKRRLDS